MGQGRPTCLEAGAGEQTQGGLCRYRSRTALRNVRRLTDSSRSSVLITGDGAFGYGISDIETSVTEHLPVVAVIAVDGAWGSVQTGVRGKYGGSTATSLPRTRFDEVAKALGAKGCWVTSVTTLDSVLDEAVSAEETVVVGVETITVPSPAVYPASTNYARAAAGAD